MITTILLIADSIDFLEATSSLLAFAGFRVIEANDGATGIALAHEHQPTVILCDMIMADMSGSAIHQALQSSSATARIPFIVMTGTQESALPEGVSCLPKPFRLDALRQTLRAAIG